MATIAQTIESMRENLSNAYTSLEGKGATIPTDKNLYNLASTIDTVTAGGGGGVTDGLARYIAGDTTLTELKASDFGDITSIAPYAFYRQSSSYSNGTTVKKMEFPNTITKIGKDAFKNYPIEEISVNLDNITGPLDNTFASATSLTKVNYGKGTINLKASSMTSMFSACRKLNDLDIVIDWNNTSQLFRNMFQSMGYSLGSVLGVSNSEIIIQGNQNISKDIFNGMFNGTRAKKVSMPDYIGSQLSSTASQLNSMFQNCYIDEVEIPKAKYLYGPSQNAYRVFSSSHIGRLKIPELLETKFMFYSTNYIEKIFFGSNCTLTGTDTSNIPATSKNFVPYTAIDTYSQGTNWATLFTNDGTEEARMAVYGNFASGDTLPTQIGTAQVYNVTWYEDDDFTTEISGTTTENKEYYGKLSAVV